ncbi:receptor-type tyrosine-protein phosphatase N2-like [Osmerus mordax]|uniref:receptor-type tyrosine-protein phosphatase N2-like n=1 Tax=Osmerus mordax TaxID=8014 RepID=UPI00350F2868
MNSFYIFLVLLAFQTHFLAFADRKFGCLFENELCTPYEICVNDGMFGRCRSPPVTESYTYDVSPSVVQRFRSLLQKLSDRGLTWGDDITQEVLSKEMSKLRRVPVPRLESGPIYSSKSRPAAQAMDPGDRRNKPVEVELSRNLQMYMQRLGLLPHTSSSIGPKTPTKSDRFHSNIPSDYYRSKSQNQQSLSSNFHPLSSFQPPYQERPPAAKPAGQAGTLLMAALRQYLSGRMPSQTGGLSSTAQAGASSRLRPYYSNGLESSRPKESSKVDTLLLKAGGSRAPPAKDPLSPIDERFIRKVLQNVGRHNVDVNNLAPQDVDQLAGLIVDALQVVDQDQGQKNARPGPRDLEEEDEEEDEEGVDEPEEDEQQGEESVSPSATEKTQESTPGEEAVLQERQLENSAHPDSNNKAPDAGVLIGKLLEYLDKTSTTESPLRKGAALLGAGGHEAAAASRVGLENVRSKTTRADVTVQKKKATQTADVEEVSEVDGWIQEVAPPPAKVVYEEPLKKNVQAGELQLDVKAVTGARKASDDDYGYVITDTEPLQTDEGLHLMEILARRAKIQMTDFLELSVVGPAVTFKVKPNNPQNVTTADVANVAVQQKGSLEKEAKVIILEAGITDKSQLNQIPTKYSQAESTKFLILTVVSILCIVGVLLASSVIYCLRHRSHHKLKEKLTNLGTDAGSDATATYQELCRQRMAVKPPAERPEPFQALQSRINSVSSQFSDGGPAVSPSARSSTSSWCEEPAHSNMDISTGHMILSYMESHLKSKDRLEKEWEALCAYQAEPNASTTGLKDGNAKKNRSNTVVAYDHSRITLKLENSQGNSDYINASPIMDHDPRNPAYIATQGPLPSTVADFWQMVWENGCVVIVMLTPLTESGVKQCYHYWPDEGSNLYHIYEVNLVSEHIWCDDFLVRSFYLKNMQTNETRTVTQFHFLTWLNQNVPESNRTLLDFRRKVNKCYRGRSCPIIVHCSDGAGRSGTYILIDMVLNKMAKGAKEIDIAATLEHLRDQRAAMVQTKEQFEFALTAVAEEVNAILKALPQ